MGESRHEITLGGSLPLPCTCHVAWGCCSVACEDRGRCVQPGRAPLGAVRHCPRALPSNRTWAAVDAFGAPRQPRSEGSGSRPTGLAPRRAGSAHSAAAGAPECHHLQDTSDEEQPGIAMFTASSLRKCLSGLRGILVLCDSGVFLSPDVPYNPRIAEERQMPRTPLTPSIIAYFHFPEASTFLY